MGDCASHAIRASICATRSFSRASTLSSSYYSACVASTRITSKSCCVTMRLTPIIIELVCCDICTWLPNCLSSYMTRQRIGSTTRCGMRPNRMCMNCWLNTTYISWDKFVTISRMALYIRRSRMKESRVRIPYEVILHLDSARSCRKWRVAGSDSV